MVLSLVLGFFIGYERASKEEIEFREEMRDILAATPKTTKEATS
jgi:hypothetical protein